MVLKNIYREVLPAAISLQMYLVAAESALLVKREKIISGLWRMKSHASFRHSSDSPIKKSLVIHTYTKEPLFNL